MAVTVTYKSDVSVVEILSDTGSLTSAGRTVEHAEYNTDTALTSATTPPVTKMACFLQALSGGSATIDLCALTGTNGATVNGDGLKVQVFKMKNLGANVMSITFGGTHPYALAGADFKVTLAQNQEWLFYGNDATPDIATDSADKMDLAGTTTQTAEISIVMG